MNLHFLTIHPAIISAYTDFGIFLAATKRRLATVSALDLRSFAVDKHGSIDDHPYGGGDGMVLRPEPIAAALNTLDDPLVIHLSPRGRLWTQRDAERLARSDRPVAFICSRFAGLDQRIVDLAVDEEFSLGDFVVSGGELPSLLVADSMLRLIPGVLGNSESPDWDSFAPSIHGYLEHDLYTRPVEFQGLRVPEVLLSGDHQKIRAWKEKNSFDVTNRRRPDLISGPT